MLWTSGGRSVLRRRASAWAALNAGPQAGIICVAKSVLTLVINLLIGRQSELQMFHAFFMPPRTVRHSLNYICWWGILWSQMDILLYSSILTYTLNNWIRFHQLSPRSVASSSSFIFRNSCRSVLISPRDIRSLLRLALSKWFLVLYALEQSSE